jgi:outer membrane protein TolC
MPELRAFFDYAGANQTTFGTAQDEWDWNWTAGLTLNWNFWDGNLTRQTVREKKLDVAKLLDDHEAITERVRLEVRQAWLQLQNARQSVEASKDSVTLAEEALRIAKARHAAGLATYLEFTDANVALSTARLTRLQSLRDHAVAIAQVRYACAMDRDMLMPPNLED